MSNETRVIWLIGSGAVDKAWAPVLEALSPADANDRETANFLMARAVYLARWGCSSDFAERIPDAAAREAEKAKLVATVRDTATSIAERIREYEGAGRLRVQSEFCRVLDHFTEHGDLYAIATTNWDGSVKRAVRDFHSDASVVHLHGTAEEGHTLYLPTEITAEPYRTSRERAEMVSDHSALIKSLDSVTRLILYGLSLSPLDAELATALAAGLYRSQIREIVIIDPNHKAVANNLLTVVPPKGRDLTITGYPPNDSHVGGGTDYPVPHRPEHL